MLDLMNYIPYPGGGGGGGGEGGGGGGGGGGGRGKPNVPNGMRPKPPVKIEFPLRSDPFVAEEPTVVGPQTPKVLSIASVPNASESISISDFLHDFITYSRFLLEKYQYGYEINLRFIVCIYFTISIGIRTNTRLINK